MFGVEDPFKREIIIFRMTRRTAFASISGRCWSISPVPVPVPMLGRTSFESISRRAHEPQSGSRHGRTPVPERSR